MIRAAASNTIRLVGASARRSTAPLSLATPHLCFHSSSRRDEEAKAVAVAPPAETLNSSTVTSIALGLTVAIPAIHYEWYLINEETQVAACFMAFCGLVYTYFGNSISDSLTAESKVTLNDANVVEDLMISNLQTSIEDLKAQKGLASELEALKHLTEETYSKLNETGKIKPLYSFKAQVEKLLSIIAAEESVAREKAKTTLMEEATAFVNAELQSSKDLKKKALANAIAALKGSAASADPVKEAYLAFFAKKKREAAAKDEKAEILQARKAIITKLNTVAMTEKFYFAFDAAGTPKMV